MHGCFVCSLFTVLADDFVSPLDNMECGSSSHDRVTGDQARVRPGAVEAGQGPGQCQGHQQREHLRTCHHYQPEDREESVSHQNSTHCDMMAEMLLCV